MNHSAGLATRGGAAPEGPSDSYTLPSRKLRTPHTGYISSQNFGTDEKRQQPTIVTGSTLYI